MLSVGLLDFSCVLNTPHQIGSHIGSEKKKKTVILTLSHSKETLADITAISYSSNSCVYPSYKDSMSELAELISCMFRQLAELLLPGLMVAL